VKREKHSRSAKTVALKAMAELAPKMRTEGKKKRKAISRTTTIAQTTKDAKIILGKVTPRRTPKKKASVKKVKKEIRKSQKKKGKKAIDDKKKTAKIPKSPVKSNSWDSSDETSNKKKSS
jgi:hypothetical protein